MASTLSVIPVEAVFDRRLGNADIRVLCALGAFADRNGKCWPATTTLAHALTDHQATLFATKLLARIQECVRSRKQLSRLVNASLKAYAGLMRYRLVRADYMTPQDPTLGDEQQRVLGSLLRRSRRENRDKMASYIKDLIKYSENRGTNRNLLQWDPEDG